MTLTAVTEPIQRICSGETVYAIVIRSKLVSLGHNFPSHPMDSLQVGVNCYPVGTRIRPHYHLTRERVIRDCVEVIHVAEGLCEVTLFDEKGEMIHEGRLVAGDTIVCLRGGHGFRCLESTRIMEVKQGPYLGDEYKVYIHGLKR